MRSPTGQARARWRRPAMAGDALRRLGVDDQPLLVVQARGPDSALLVVDANASHALLRADVLDDRVDALGVVTQHHVVGRATNGLGKPVGRERDDLVELLALAIEAEPVRSVQDRGGPEAQAEPHTNGEAPPGAEAPRGTDSVVLRRHVLTGAGASTG